MKKIFITATFVFCTIFVSCYGSGGNQDFYKLPQHQINEFLASSGIFYVAKNDLVEITVDENKAIAAVPNLQSSNIINSEITETFINNYPEVSAANVGLIMTGSIISYYYANSKADLTHFKVYLLQPDDYGNINKKLLISFDFNRNLFNKINWTNFDNAKLAKVALNFKITAWYSKKLSTVL